MTPTCENCGTELIYKGAGRRPTRFCSGKCKDKIKGQERRAAAVAKVGERRCRVCSNVIPDTVTLKAVCCSRACGVTYQNRRRDAVKKAQTLADRKPCEHCRGPIPEGRTAQAIYCSWRCKHNSISESQRKTTPGYMRQYVYGVPPQQYAGMLDEQGHACAICGSTEWAGPGRGSGKPHVDHNHATGKVRSLLCGYCNLGIGHFHDDPEKLRAAARYLERQRE